MIGGWSGRLATLVVAGLPLLGVSCTDGPKLHPVRGTVLFEGQPVAGASVVLHPADPNAPMPSGRTGPDGSFTLSTHPHGDGAPAGTYVVLITQYPADAHEQEDPKNLLPDRYADLEAALLKVTVRDGPNELEPFRLTKK